MTKTINLPHVVIIGAGAAGVSAALMLAKEGYRVDLIEENSLFSGSSSKTPGRLGLGFHYIDPKTAEMYLKASILVQRTHPNYLRGADLEKHHPIRRGRYMITNDSDYKAEKIINAYETLREAYRKLIQEDPANEVFGSPDQFFRILERHEYEDTINASRVVAAVETAEHLFDWPKFSEDIREVIATTENITLYENMSVINIERGDLGEARFIIHTKSMKENGSTQQFTTDYIVNSTWQNIQKLNEQAGLTMIPGSRTNRLKALIVLKLPESLKNSHSMFFCMGQHCMMSNLGNGFGMVTYALKTNIETSTALMISDHAKKLLSDDINDPIISKEKDDLANEIKAGVAQYIPEIANATIESIKFGIIQTEGSLSIADLADPNSVVHNRDYYSVAEEQIGLISNPCIKLFYFVKNGQLVRDLMNLQLNATRFIEHCVKTIKDKFNLPKEIEKSFIGLLERTTNSDYISKMQEKDSKNFTKKFTDDLCDTREKKMALNEQVRNFNLNALLKKSIEKSNPSGGGNERKIKTKKQHNKNALAEKRYNLINRNNDNSVPAKRCYLCATTFFRKQEPYFLNADDINHEPTKKRGRYAN